MYDLTEFSTALQNGDIAFEKNKFDNILQIIDKESKSKSNYFHLSFQDL